VITGDNGGSTETAASNAFPLEDILKVDSGLKPGKQSCAKDGVLAKALTRSQILTIICISKSSPQWSGFVHQCQVQTLRSWQTALV
jgi:hypothetical protein